MLSAGRRSSVIARSPSQIVDPDLSDSALPARSGMEVCPPGDGGPTAVEARPDSGTGNGAPAAAEAAPPPVEPSVHVWTVERKLPQGGILRTTYERRVVDAVRTGATCTACKSCPGKRKCAWAMCKPCCFAAENACDEHKTPAWVKHKEAEEKARRQLARERRGPCRYFMSGMCSAGDKCPYDHGGLDESPLGHMRFNANDKTLEKRLRLRSAEEASGTSPVRGDKVLLPQSVLIEALQKDLDYPMLWSIAPAGGDKDAPAPIHCGVLDFTAAEGECVAPGWMVRGVQAAVNGASDEDAGTGVDVIVRYASLPKGAFCRLQPVWASWLEIPVEDRHAILEQELARFQTLTEGSRITIEYGGDAFEMAVVECKPSRAVCIIDADLETDVMEPMEEAHKADLARPLRRGEARHTGTATCSSPARFVVDPQLWRAFDGVEIRCSPLSGDPDLYVSQVSRTPDRTRYTWTSQEQGDCAVVIWSDDAMLAARDTGPIYVGVCPTVPNTAAAQASPSTSSSPLGQGRRATLSGSKTLLPAVSGGEAAGERPCEFVITARPLRRSEDGELVTPGRHRHRSGRMDGDSFCGALDDSEAQEKCANCGRWFPPTRLVMHERQCARNAKRCEQCGVVVPALSEEKHRAIHHVALQCGYGCGACKVQLELHEHQLSGECPLALVQCPHPWCGMRVKGEQLASHKTACASRPIACELCDESVRREEMAFHLEAMHNVDTSLVNWRAPLLSQILRPLNDHVEVSVGSAHASADASAAPAAEQPAAHATEAGADDDDGDEDDEISAELIEHVLVTYGDGDDATGDDDE